MIDKCRSYFAVVPYTPDPSHSVATLSIEDNDLITVTASGTPSEQGQVPGTYTFTRSGSTAGALTLTYQISGSAQNGVDYQGPGDVPLSGTIIIGAGNSTATLSITPVNDHDNEGYETAVLTLNSGSNYTADPTPATLSIADNEVWVTAGSDLASEDGPTSRWFTLHRSGPITADLQVAYTMSGAALNGVDYLALPNSNPAINYATILAGNSSVDVELAPINDDLKEENENATLTIGSGAYTVASGLGSALLTIDDNDQWIVEITAPTVHAFEAEQFPGAFELTRSGETDLTHPLTVCVSLGTSTAGSGDYAPLQESYEIPAGETSLLIPVIPTDDAIDEETESVILDLVSDPAYSSAPSDSAEVAIHDRIFADWSEIDFPENATDPISFSETDAIAYGLTYSISGGDDAAQFTINAASGLLAFITPPNFEIPTDFNADNVYRVQIRATDGLGNATSKLIFISVADVNEKPEITNAPDDPLEAPFGLSPDVKIYQFKAKDPDNEVVPDKQRLTFSLVDPSDTFKITPHGELRRKDEIWAGTPFDPSVEITVIVTDSGDPAKSDSKSVTIEFTTGTTIFAKQQAIEGGDTKISLTFRRYSADISEPLTLHYQIKFGGIVGGADQLDFRYQHVSPHDASADDLTADSLLAVSTDPPTQGVYDAYVTIESDKSTSNPVVLVAKSDDALEGVELFSVKLLDGEGYKVLEESVEDPFLPEGGRSAVYQGSGQHTLAIVDGVTLFAPYNTAQTLRDYVSEDSELGENPGIHANDVRQGSVGNCYLMAAIESLVEKPEGWRAISRLFRPSEGGGFSVALYEPDAEGLNYAWRWRDYSAADLLPRGTIGAILSGDRDIDGKSEIWCVLLERRFMESTYSARVNYGGTVGAFLALTGVNAEIIDTSGMSNPQIIEALNARLSGFGGFLVVGTKSSFDNHQNELQVNANPDTIYANHAYVLSAVSATNGLTLKNPWGSENVDPLPIDKIDDVLSLFVCLSPDYGTGP